MQEQAYICTMILTNFQSYEVEHSIVVSKGIELADLAFLSSTQAFNPTMTYFRIGGEESC